MMKLMGIGFLIPRGCRMNDTLTCFMLLIAFISVSIAPVKARETVNPREKASAALFRYGRLDGGTLLGRGYQYIWPYDVSISERPYSPVSNPVDPRRNLPRAFMLAENELTAYGVSANKYMLRRIRQMKLSVNVEANKWPYQWFEFVPVNFFNQVTYDKINIPVFLGGVIPEHIACDYSENQNAVIEQIVANRLVLPGGRLDNRYIFISIELDNIESSPSWFPSSSSNHVAIVASEAYAIASNEVAQIRGSLEWSLREVSEWHVGLAFGVPNKWIYLFKFDAYKDVKGMQGEREQQKQWISIPVLLDGGTPSVFTHSRDVYSQEWAPSGRMLGSE